MRGAGLPDLGGRGEGWVAGQFVLLAGIALSALVGLGTWTALVVAGSVLMVAGFVLIVVGSVQLGSALTPFPRPRSDAALVERGLYRRARHPVYGGAILVAAGWSLAWATIVGGVLTALLVVFFDLKSRREEAWLAARYPEYDAYRRRTRRRLLPYVY